MIRTSMAPSPLELLHPSLKLDGLAEELTGMVADQLNLMSATSLTGEDGIGGRLRPEPLNIHTDADNVRLRTLLRDEGRRFGLRPGDCGTIEIATAPVSPDRAKNTPVVFASGHYQIGLNGVARLLDGVTGGQVLDDGFMNEGITIEERGMLDYMKRAGARDAVRIDPAPADICRRLELR